VRAKDAGFEVIYQGIRLSPEQIVASAWRGRRRHRPVDPLRLAHDPGAARARAPARAGQRHAGRSRGIIPTPTASSWQALGVSRVWTPGEATLTDIIADLVEVIAAAQSRAA